MYAGRRWIVRVIRTVTGDIPAESLGVAAPHEHLWCDNRLCRTESGFPSMEPPLVLNEPDLIVQELSTYYSLGGRAIVDATVEGWGRDIERLHALSVESGIRIIATSGFYTQNCHPSSVEHSSVEELAALLIAEVKHGADGTDICTGLLKAALSRPQLDGAEKKCTRAVARAQRQTGAALFVHSPAAHRFEIAGGNGGVGFLDLLATEGVDPQRVIVGHVDSNPDVRQLLALARRGAVIEFDLIGRTERLLDDTRVELICRLVDRGYARQLLLSADVCRKSDLRVGGGRGYSYVLERFLPRLRRAGFDDDLLGEILQRNPARVLSMEVDDS